MSGGRLFRFAGASCVSTARDEAIAPRWATAASIAVCDGPDGPVEPVVATNMEDVSERLFGVIQLDNLLASLAELPAGWAS